VYRYNKGMVNYVAFAAVVDPKEDVYHPYLLDVYPNMKQETIFVPAPTA
jgi:hypothetical protein